MTPVITFSRQNDAGLRTHTIKYKGNNVLVVVFVLDSKVFYYQTSHTTSERNYVNFCFYLATFDSAAPDKNAFGTAESWTNRK